MLEYRTSILVLVLQGTCTVPGTMYLDIPAVQVQPRVQYTVLHSTEYNVLPVDLVQVYSVQCACVHSGFLYGRDVWACPRHQI